MTAVVYATKHGAKFTQELGEWVATYHPRARSVPMVRFTAPTKEQVADMYCAYFNLLRNTKRKAQP